MRLFVLLNTKEDILQNDILAPLTSIRGKFGSQWCPPYLVVKILKKYHPLCSAVKRKVCRFGTN